MQKQTSYSSSQTDTNTTKRTIGFVVVVALHAGAYYAMESGLAKTMLNALTGPLQASLIEEVVTQDDAPAPPPPEFEAPPPPPKIVPPRSNPRRPITQPEYPVMSRRLGEEGQVILLLTVDQRGRVVEAKVEVTSGFERLDEAALVEATRRWRLIPGTINGKPTRMQYKFAVTFRIEDAQ